MKKENKIKETTIKSERILWNGSKVIEERDASNKQLIKETGYYFDSKAIRWIEEFDKDNGNILKTTFYRKNGTIEFIEEHRKQNFKIEVGDDRDNIIKITYYDNDNNITDVKYGEGIDPDELMDGYYANRDNDGDVIDN